MPSGAFWLASAAHAAELTGMSDVALKLLRRALQSSSVGDGASWAMY